ncbi:hypothetical protein Syun_011865 [Stephania yunnanensis]|uniref:Uncharacterized protein n=1 Tax=Stephania yunnanensis TaxID=152371 RepID=A0AAP0PIH6_9MAGN
MSTMPRFCPMKVTLAHNLHFHMCRSDKQISLDDFLTDTRLSLKSQGTCSKTWLSAFGDSKNILKMFSVIYVNVILSLHNHALMRATLRPFFKIRLCEATHTRMLCWHG